MKGDPKVIPVLNDLLSDELTAISQYMVHSEMCANWGYEKLHKAVEKRAVDEMKHAEKLIGRILFLEGIPVVSELKKISVGKDVPAQLKNDRGSEEGAIKSYNEAIRKVAEMGDHGTADFLKEILKDEEVHIDWLETQLGLIDKLGIENYLAQQM